MLPRHEHHDELDLVYDDEVTVLKKNTDGWWYGKRIVFNKRQDRSWFAEGWFPGSYVEGDRWLQKNTGDHWGGHRNDEWDFVVMSSNEPSLSGSVDTESLTSEQKKLVGSTGYGAHLLGRSVADLEAESDVGYKDRATVMEKEKERRGLRGSVAPTRATKKLNKRFMSRHVHRDHMHHDHDGKVDDD